MEKCPCGSGKAYEKCCEPFLLGKKQVVAPEELLRSRYSAYVKKNLEYINQTVAGPAARDFGEKDARDWADYVVWQGLKIVNILPPEGDNAKIEFIAYYVLNNRQQLIHEISEFRQQDGKWYYYDGKYPKVGRNDLCPCSSGKKYKKCCGKG